MMAGTGVRVPTWTISRTPGSCPARAAAKFALKKEQDARKNLSFAPLIELFETHNCFVFVSSD